MDKFKQEQLDDEVLEQLIEIGKFSFDPLVMPVKLRNETIDFFKRNGVITIASDCSYILAETAGQLCCQELLCENKDV